MKVLHTEWSDGWGGQEMRIINEMIAVRKKGIEVCLACRDNAKIKQKALENKIEVFTLAFDGAYDLKTMFALSKIIKKESIDIVNTHSGKDTWVGGFAAKLAGVKFIRTRHLSNKINPSRLNFINEMADFIITTGEGVREDMIKYNRIKPEKIMSIPTGIDENMFDPAKYDKNECREMFGFEKKIVVGTLGVLRGVKGHIFLIDAAKELLTKYNNIEFAIAGDGPLKEHLKNKSQGYVRLLGHQNGAKFLNAIDIFVLPSKNEGVPQSLIQALMMNIPSIATNVGSVKDLYKDNNFFLVEPENVEMLVKQISFVIDNYKTNNTRKYMVEKFSLNNMTKKIVDIYQKVLR